MALINIDGIPRTTTQPQPGVNTGGPYAQVGLNQVQPPNPPSADWTKALSGQAIPYGSSTPGPTASTTSNPFANPGGTDVNSIISQGIKSAYGRDANPNDLAYWSGQWANLQARGQQLNNPDYAWQRLIGQGATGADAATAGPYAGGSASSGSGGNIFSDPATQQWEQQLNQRIQQLQTPYQNPAFDQAIGQLNSYLTRLNGPTYTPAQMDLMQTQALDPIEQQRTAQKQNVLQRLASRGISPSSGLTEQALEQVDQQANQQRTQTQAGFATGAIGQSNQNAAQAAQIAPGIAQLFQQQFQGQDARNQQAVDLSSQIPATAWSRLTGAQSGIQNPNAASLLQLLSGFQQQGYNQNANYTSGIAQALAQLFGLG